MSSASLPHRLFRLSLRELLVLVTMVALAIGSLKYASDVWLALVVALTMIALFAALIVAVVDRGPRQAFAIGFALVMVAYGLILTTGQRTSGLSGNLTSKNIEFDQWHGRLPTTHLLRHVHRAVDRSEWTPVLPELRRGVTGELVEVLQRMLNARVTPSPNLQVDGEFGPLTDRAVKRLQTQAGLGATGIVDMATWKTLGLVFDAKTRRVTIPGYARGSATTPNVSGGGMAGGIWCGGASFREIPPREIFMPIGHCWWALLLGYVGGWFASYVYLRRIKEQASPP